MPVQAPRARRKPDLQAPKIGDLHSLERFNHSQLSLKNLKYSKSQPESIKKLLKTQNPQAETINQFPQEFDTNNLTKEFESNLSFADYQ
jgi:hypothetical protein